MAPLVDSLGRVHTYLRISVTDRCNYRCTYCMPAEGFRWMPHEQVLSYEEIARLARIFASAGVRRLRLTGGEPTLRKDLPLLVAMLAEIPGIQDIALTTNGHFLVEQAEPLARAGLRRINISLDSLRPERFSRLTRGGDLARVLRGIEAAHAAGLRPVKINAVLLKGENEDEVEELVEHFGRQADRTELRFIEYMPFEARWHQCVPAAKVRQRLAERYTLIPQRGSSGEGPARSWMIEESGLLVGFISPLTEHFCAGCNRLRLMANGHLRTCLAHEDTPSLRDLLRQGASDELLDEAIRAMVMGKPWGHDCQADGGTLFEGVMTGVGG
jgi:GTP 3',8-cyclase